MSVKLHPVARVVGGQESVRAFTLPGLLSHTFPARRPLLLRAGEAILREGHLAEIVAPRGIGKTWLLQTLALVCASGNTTLGLTAAEAFRVLFVDGEMSSEELQARFQRLCVLLDLDPPDCLTVVGADWQDTYLPRLDTPEGQAAIAPLVEAADLVILDNRSCLFDPEGEKDGSAWQPAQDWLLGLRRQGKAVLLAHHANRAGGARGISRAEDALDLVMKLERPPGYQQDQGARFVVTFDKARGIHGRAAAPFVCALTSAGWVLEHAETEESGIRRKLLGYLATCQEIGERPGTATAAVVGAQINKQQGLRAFAELLKQGVIGNHPSGGYGLA